MSIQDATDQQEGDAQPCQDEAITEATFAQISGVIKNLLSVKGEDEARRKVGEACESNGKSCCRST